jgi:polar amino acid transport system ATP-binding protein
MPIISLRDVRKRFGSVEILRGVDLDVDAGEVVAIIGKSGSGKSTLLRCVNGLENVTSGSIRVDNVDATSTAEAERRALRMKVGMIFQQFNLFPHLTAGRNVMLSPMIVKKMPKSQARALAEAMLTSVGLSDKFDAYPSQLSGGQQQRVAIARALAMEPLALLCDEITSALDPELVKEVLSVISLLAAQGKTIILVTHEMEFARRVCDRIGFMHKGNLTEIGKAQDIFENPRTPELRQFLGV